MRRDDPSDIAEAEKNEVFPIDIVCVNLYPFPEVVKRADIDLQTKIENIDSIDVTKNSYIEEDNVSRTETESLQFVKNNNIRNLYCLFMSRFFYKKVT